MAGRFSVEAVFRAIDKISGPVSKMSNRVGRFTRRAERNFALLNRSVDKFGGGLRRVGMVGAAAMGGVGYAAADVVKTGADFEQALVNAAAKFGNVRKGSEAFQKIEAAAAKAGATTEFTAKASADALNYLAMAGFSAEQSVAALPAVIDLATSSQTDLATAADIATDSLGAMGLATKDATQLGINLARVNDVMAKTSTTANTTMELMMETIKDGGPVATAAGASLETFMALTGELANSGIKGSQAGTTLKNVFLKLSAATPAAARELKKMGVATKDSEGNLRDVVDILGDIQKGTEGMGSATKSAALNTIFGMRAIAGVNVLLNTGADKLDKYRKQLEGSTGASKDMAAMMRDTVMGRLKGLESAVESVKIAFYKLKNEGVQKLIDKLTEFVRNVGDTIKENEKLVKSLGEDLFGAAVSVIEIFGWLVGAYVAAKLAIFAFNTFVLISKGLMLVVTGLQWAWVAATVAWTAVTWLANAAGAAFVWTFGALLSPIILVIAAVAAVIAIIVLLIVYWDDVSAAASDAWDWIVEKTKAAVKWISEAIDTLMAPFSAIGKALESIGFKGGKLKAIIETKQSGGDAELEAALGERGADMDVTSPQSRFVSEQSSTSSTSNFELLIRDEQQNDRKKQTSLTGPQQSISRTSSGDWAIAG